MLKKKPKKRWILILILLGIIVLWNGYQKQEQTLLSSTNTHTDSSLFDSRKWISYSDSACHRRQYMAKDLIDHHLDKNMDTLEIKNILGIPIVRNHNPLRFYYDLGYHKDFKPLFLIITWNPQGNTIKASASIEEY